MTATRAQATLLLLALAVGRPALAQQCPDGTPPPCAPRRVAPPVDARAIVILPFRVHGPPEVQYLAEGMVDLFQSALDGVGGLRVLYPRPALRRLRQLPDPSDPTRAASTVRSLGAGLLIAGSVVAAGSELRIRAELHDAARERRLVAVDARGDAGRVGSLVDSLASAILTRRLLAAPGSRGRRLDDYATRSPSALQAFLVAGQHERRGEWPAAIDSLESALVHDSTFALAYYVLYWVITNRKTLIGQIPGGLRSALQRGLRHQAHAPDRVRQLFLMADDYVQGMRLRATALADESATRFPADVDVAFQQADIYFHFGLQLGEPPGRVTEMLGRVLALDEEIPEAYDHFVLLLAASGDTAAAWEALRHERALAPEDEEAVAAELAMRAVFRYEDPWQLVRGARIANATFAADRAQQKAIRMSPADLGRGIALADSFAAFLAAPEQQRSVRLTALFRRFAYALAQGRYRAAWSFVEAAAVLSPGDPGMLGRVVLYNLVCGARLPEAREAARRLADLRPSALAMTAAVAWHTVLRLPPESVETAIAPLEHLPWPDSVRGQALVAGLRGLLARRLGDTARAREMLARAYEVQTRLTGLHAVLFPSAVFSLTLADLERAAGDAPAARLRLADVYPEHEVLPFIAKAEEMRAEIREQLADTAGARTALRRVIGLWERADPELQPRVAAARAALARLERR